MYAVETALTVPILTSLRVPESFYSMAWLISPILGFFLQPIIGMWSDTCKCKWGRRRPFILAFAIGAFLGVTLLLNSSDLGVLLGDSTDKGTIPYKAVILTAVGVTFLDFCADSADAPIRAYLIDTTNPADQERGFNIHAILGFGGGLGFIVGAIHWDPIPMFTKHGGEFSVIFYVASVLFIICSISTLTSVREEPLISSSRNNNDTDNFNDDDQAEIDGDEKRPLLSLRRNSSRAYNTNKGDRTISALYLSGLNNQEGFLEIDTATGTNVPHDHIERSSESILLQKLEDSHQVVAASMTNADPSNPVPVPTQAFEAELKQKAKLVKLGLMRRPASEEIDDFDKEDNVTIKSMIISMVRMPPRLWKLMICQVIGWIGYFATHLYFTDFIAQTVYNGTMEDPNDAAGLARYRLGVTMGCWGLFLYSASSALYAFALERWLAEKYSLKTLYFVGYFVYAIGCMVNFFVHEIVVNIAMCFTFGMLVVSLNTLPYHMLSQFHADDSYKNKDGTKRGIGVDCSLLNSCYFLGELVVAVSLGPLLERTGVNYCMVIGAAFTLFGNICMFFLFFFKN
ncbi:unnamed protein product [Adineta steineri]|uniref:Uncharacterized protein n=1 Tax=Adineta steineri TaxID=433720 RepID=A0A814GF63_9BILA|nr:unnamed protein product [Adineta steineri]CAF3542702.1 unnamed protein product [Adineta steineri]CAF3620275.1 unnamed protein product [Adineta steineri]